MSSRRTRRAPRTEDKPESVASLARFFLLLLLFAWALRSLVVQPFNIPSGSMLPTLYIGDYVMVAKWPYGYSRYSFPFGFPSFDGRVAERTPKRGDVVVFRHPAANEDLIKRVIAIPGDTIAVSNGVPILNGRSLKREAQQPAAIPVTPNSPCRAVTAAARVIEVRGARPTCVYPAYLETLPGGMSYTIIDQVERGPADDFGPVRVPAGRVFLMGDNRDDSLDSRFPASQGGIGMVPVDRLIGRALVTFWSTDGSAAYWKPWTWFTALRPARIGNGYSGRAE